MPPSSVGKNRWVKGETRNVLGGVSRGSYAQAPSRASESVFSDDLSSNGSYSQNVGHFGAHASYQAHSTAAGARAGYRNGRANYVANASSFTTSACSQAGKAAVMVCIVVGAAFLAFGGDRVGDVYSKLAPSAEAFTSRIDDEAILDNVVNGVHKAAADAATRPGFERSSFSAAEGEGTAEDDDDDAFIKRAFADQPPLVVPTPAHRSKKKLAKLTQSSTEFLRNAFKGDANDAFVRSAYGDGKFLADAYGKTEHSKTEHPKTEHSKTEHSKTEHRSESTGPVAVDARAEAEAAPAETKKAKSVETVDVETATETKTKTRPTETEQRLAREVRARRASSGEVSTRDAEKKEKTKDEPSSFVHREASKPVEKTVDEPSATKAVEVSRTGKGEHHDGGEKEGKTKDEKKDEKKEEALQEEARRQAEEIMADAAKASAHAESDFKPTEVPAEGEVRLSCVADETGVMHCEYPGAFDGETPTHTPKHGDKKKSHHEEASEGKKESGSHRESSNHREKAKLGAEIWKPVGMGKQIPVTLHPFEADEMTRLPAGVDM